jgi:alanyl-tRNA synthetase
MSDLQEELDGLKNDRKEIENTLNLEMNSFAEAIKSGLGDEIKKELLNPTIKPIKKTKKEIRKEKWLILKEKLNSYFFPENKNGLYLSDEL